MAEILSKKAEVADHELPPPPPYLKHPNVQSLLVKYSNKLWTKAEVTDPQTGDVMCAIKYKMVSRPNLIYTLPNEETEFANATLHNLHSRLDIHIRGQPLDMKKEKLLKCEYKYCSPAFQGQTMTWVSKSGWTSFDFICTDERQMPVAKITADGWSLKKVCKIEFLGESCDSEVAREEIIVTGLTLTFRMLINYYSAAGAGGASGAAAIGV